MLFPLVVFLLVFLHVPFTMGCIALMLLGAQWYILFNVIAGASAIPAELKEAGIVYSMSRSERWTHLYLPSVFPYLVTGLITAAGGAWNATIVAEYLTIKSDQLHRVWSWVDHLPGFGRRRIFAPCRFGCRDVAVCRSS